MAHREPTTALPAARAGSARGGGAVLSRLIVPERLPGIVDAHAHLQHQAFDADRAAVLERARAAGLARLLVPGWDRSSSQAAVALAAEHPDLLDAAVGVHPHHAAATEPDWAALEALSAQEGVLAVGEIGLDFFRNLSPPDTQLAAFRRQLDLATALGKPVIVHDRDAHDPIEAALLGFAERSTRPVKGVLHAFSGDRAMAERLVDAGFLISFALPISFSSNHGPRDAAAHLPADRILVETDAPWLGLDREARNEPTTVLRVAAAVARLRGDTPEGVASAAGASYRALRP